MMRSASHGRLSLLGLVVALAIVFIPEARAEAKKTPTPSAACLAAAAAKELGAAARERFLAQCTQTGPATEQSEEQITIGTEPKSKLSDAEKTRIQYCTTLAAGRNLSGMSRDTFLRECLTR